MITPIVRNLMLASVANHDLESQEIFYFRYWLKPIEQKVSNVTEYIGTFTQQFDDIKYESKTEIFAKQFLKSKPICDQGKSIMIYAKFYSLYEWRLRLINKTTEITFVNPNLMLEVTKEILTEMAEAISSK